MSRDQIKVGSATTLAPSQRQQALCDHRQSRQFKFRFLANQKPSAGSTSSGSTLNPSSAIYIADSPSNNSPRFSANGPPSSHDPSNDIFSMDLFNALSSSS
ncbi:hypothetical protein PGT21_013551 [Puccinia graminis f. sp. tritici]|uniref:Uncharacterized protein n=1 Tax=Puccinia graminis f. sp. tritici TaxID=56615 RepID=A0A5B0MA73_PUCGR|nr:hypothetical protein PGT21_010388 [Puccinia graminis f. sp. tritici]KAA1073491.1 hypothetical protein PGT21_013551 [Puccinia graminis f. sp. tritici]KAA1122097.1 hypothetical protein PGTUg99_027189 [Puccinia graminis f. sp. tritici]